MTPKLLLLFLLAITQVCKAQPPMRNYKMVDGKKCDSCLLISGNLHGNYIDVATFGTVYEPSSAENDSVFNIARDLRIRWGGYISSADFKFLFLPVRTNAAEHQFPTWTHDKTLISYRELEYSVRHNTK
ncbi:MAG: hypothetical protein EON58_11755, partial [Alphaproteobacteria bacterium]